MATRSAQSTRRKKPEPRKVTEETVAEKPTLETSSTTVLKEPEGTNDPVAVAEDLFAAREAAVSSSEKRSVKKVWIASVFIIMVLVLLGAGAYFILNASHTNSKNPQDIVEQVGKLVLLPAGETPSVALVKDVTKLPKVPLFADAQNGDRVLIYTTAKRAFLFRPSINKVIAISDVSIQTPEASSVIPPSASPSARLTPVLIKVAIYNGTDTTGLAHASEKGLLAKNPGINVTTTGDAKKKEYTKTVVIDLSGKQQVQAKAIATYFGASVSTLPVGETKPTNADILIILGTDYQATTSK